MDNVRLSSLPPGLLPPLESGQQRPAPRPPAADDRASSPGEDQVTLSAEGRARARRDVGAVVENVALPSDRPGVQAYRQEAGRPVAPPLPQGEVYEGVFQRLGELAASLASSGTNPAPDVTEVPGPSSVGAPNIPATPEVNSTADYARATQPGPAVGSRIDVFA